MRAPGLVGDASAFPDAVQRVSLHPFLRAATPLLGLALAFVADDSCVRQLRAPARLGIPWFRETPNTRHKRRHGIQSPSHSRPDLIRSAHNVRGFAAPPVTHEAGYAGVMAHSHPLHTSRTAASHNAARSPSHIDVKSTSCTWPSGRPRACPRQRRAPCRPRRTPSSGSS